MNIGIAGAESRSLGGIQKPEHFQTIAPGHYEHNDSTQKNKMIFHVFRKGDFRHSGHGTPDLAEIPFYSQGTVFQIPAHGYQCSHDKKNQQPVLDEDVKRQREQVKADVPVKNRVGDAKRLLMQIPQEQFPLVWALWSNVKGAKQNNSDHQGFYRCGGKTELGRIIAGRLKTSPCSHGRV